MAAVKRRRRNSGDLRHLRTETWAMILFLSETIADDTLPLEGRLKAAAGMCVSAGVYRNILADVREERRRAELDAMAPRPWLRALPPPVEAADDDLDPEDIEGIALQQSRALASVPRSRVVPRVAVVEPRPPEPDPEEARIAAMEREVKDLIDAVKGKLRTSSTLVDLVVPTAR